MFNFDYHIPSAMVDNHWNRIVFHFNNDIYVAKAALLRHYLGSEAPEEVEIWVRRKARTGLKKPQVRRFYARQKGSGLGYDVERIKEKESVT